MPLTLPLILETKVTAFGPRILAADCSTLTILSVSLALPLVALPPKVFEFTKALPVSAVAEMLFVSVALRELFTFVLLPVPPLLIVLFEELPVLLIVLVPDGLF